VVVFDPKALTGILLIPHAKPLQIGTYTDKFPLFGCSISQNCSQNCQNCELGRFFDGNSDNELAPGTGIYFVTWPNIAKSISLPGYKYSYNQGAVA
jgi:hypothetical protein